MKGYIDLTLKPLHSWQALSNQSLRSLLLTRLAPNSGPMHLRFLWLECSLTQSHLTSTHLSEFNSKLSAEAFPDPQARSAASVIHSYSVSCENASEFVILHLFGDPLINSFFT
jgi:hypothetical protein